MTKELILTQGRKTVVDDEDFDWLKKYKCFYNSEYACTIIEIEGKRRRIGIHRLIVNCPKHLEVDHINGNKLDNRKNNLRICTREENLRNFPKMNRPSTSIYKGVKWYDKSSMWVCRISKDKKRVHIGYFKDEISAANAYNYYAKLYYKEFARLNEVEYMSKEEWEKNRAEKKEAQRKSNYKGIYWHKSHKKWTSSIKHEGKVYNIGLFEAEEDALMERNKKCRELGLNKKIQEVIIKSE